MLPIPLNSLGLIVSTRLVPSAFGFPGHASVDAQADPPVTAREMNRNKNPMKRIRTRTPAFIRAGWQPKVGSISGSIERSLKILLMHSKMRPVWGAKSGAALISALGHRRCESDVRFAPADEAPM